MYRAYLSLILLLFLIGCQSQTLQEHLLEPPPPLINFALSRNGATAVASQSVPNHRPEEVIDGDTNSDTWDEGSGWGCSLEHLRTSDLNKRPYVLVELAKPVDIRRIVVWTIDAEQYPAKRFGLKDYRIEYWHGTGWGLIPSGDTKDKQYTARSNTKGTRIHEIQQRLIAQKSAARPSLLKRHRAQLPAHGGETSRLRSGRHRAGDGTGDLGVRRADSAYSQAAGARHTTGGD